MDAKWGTPGLNANAFTISVALFGCTTGLMGNWVDRNGPFWSVIITILTTPIGWGLASVGSKFELLGLVYFGFALHGIGTGFAYISTCAAIQKWFSEFKGLATGLAVLGFGLGSFIWTTVGRTFLDSKGDYKWLPWQVQAVFAGESIEPFACGYAQPQHRSARTCRPVLHHPLHLCPFLAPASP